MINFLVNWWTVVIKYSVKLSTFGSVVQKAHTVIAQFIGSVGRILLTPVIVGSLSVKSAVH